MENVDCDVNHHETCWPPVLPTLGTVSTLSTVPLVEPTLQMREFAAASWAGPRGHAGLPTVHNCGSGGTQH